MRIAEHRQAIGAKLDAAPHRIEAGRDGLVRQPVDQVEIHPCNTGLAQIVGRGGGLLETLHPVDGALHDRVETLHAKTGPVDAAKGQRVDHLGGQRARVDLDRNFGRGQHEEGMPERPDQVGE